MFLVLHGYVHVNVHVQSYLMSIKLSDGLCLCRQVPVHWHVVIGVQYQVQVHVWLQVHVQVPVKCVMDIIVCLYFVIRVTQTNNTCPTSSKGLLGDLPCQGLRQGSFKLWSVWISGTEPTIFEPSKGFIWFVPVISSSF